MITGSNTNVRYRGKIFHVQTEDSGRERPHIISHVYHGGTILASEKSEYREKIDAEDLDTLVRGLIEAQHRSMVERLKGGEFDDAIIQRLEGATARPARGAASRPAASERAREARPAAARRREGPLPSFGERIISKRPLDEEILEYLVQKARSSRSKG